MSESLWLGEWHGADGHASGLLAVEPDGSITLMPDDFFYQGTIDAKVALEIAEAILSAQKSPGTR